MPKYSGLVDLKGTFGNLSFYQRKGVNCVRRPGGFSKERIETDPALRRVLEHTAEFGAQSMASRSLRTSLAPVKKYWDGTFHNRLMKIGAAVTSPAEGGTRRTARRFFASEGHTTGTAAELQANPRVIVPHTDQINTLSRAQQR